VLNGGQVGISAFDSTNVHSLIYQNYVNGVGEFSADGGFTFGINGLSGSWTQNTVAWWNPISKVIANKDFGGSATQSNNTFEGKAHVTLSEAQGLANSWFNYMSTNGITIGYGTVPSITWPVSSDYP
jgi:hypothetical protein